MKHRLLLLLCALLVLLDLGGTFVQYSRMVLDGDLAAIVLPTPVYLPVLHDPFGLHGLAQGVPYAAPNRFFAHASEMAYFRAVPGWLQQLGLSPVDSLYAAQALFCTVLQALLVYVLATYAVGSGRPGNWRLWLAMALVAPFFQAQGYASEMALVPQAVTYAFFYALPLLLLLVLLRPFYRWAGGQPWRLSAWGVVGSVGLVVVLAFDGPVIPGVVAVLLLGTGLHWLCTAGPPAGWGAQLRSLPRTPLLLLALLGGLCAYSLYLGRLNAENSWQALALAERYQRLPLGVVRQLTGKLGLPLLVLLCLGNAYLLRRWLPAQPDSARSRVLLRGVGWFALAYVLLLPLGGYRGYRPNLLRFDAISPITLALVLGYGTSALCLLRHLPGRARTAYAAAVVIVAFVYANADRKLQVADGNGPERVALAHLARAPAHERIVHLPDSCPVLSWQPVTRPMKSTYSAVMLYYWGVTPRPRRYYH